MKNLQQFLVVAFVSSILAACNTIHGAGQDISSGGKGLSTAATDVQKKM